MNEAEAKDAIVTLLHCQIAAFLAEVKTKAEAFDVLVFPNSNLKL